MDPIANIERQRELVAEILARPTTYTSIDTDDPSVKYSVLTSATELAEHVQALDEWRLAGGFDPYAPDLAGRIKNIRLAITFHQAQLDNAPTLDEINQALGQVLSAGGH